jgi:hypothetical protein
MLIYEKEIGLSKEKIYTTNRFLVLGDPFCEFVKIDELVMNSSIDGTFYDAVKISHGKIQDLKRY